MRLSSTRNSQSITRRLWEVFITSRTYRARQLLMNRSK